MTNFEASIYSVAAIRKNYFYKNVYIYQLIAYVRVERKCRDALRLDEIVQRPALQQVFFFPDLREALRARRPSFSSAKHLAHQETQLSVFFLLLLVKLTLKLWLFPTAT